jgi:dipeptidyl aminopeptidase/acylaminoacyl peptidase
MRTLVGVLLALAFVPASADASVIAYTCGGSFEDVCQARPDGNGQRVLLADGDASRRYLTPALSRDGRRLAYVVDGDLWIRDLVTGRELHGIAQSGPVLVRWRGDGARIAVGELALTSTRNEVCTYNADLSGDNEGRSCRGGGLRSGFAYRPDGRLWMNLSGGTQHQGRSILCTLLPENGPSGCADDFRVSDPAFSLESPDLSPDGRLLAVVRAASGTEGAIALYDAATGALVRTLTNGPADAAPVFSPDGRRIAFARTGAGIWTTRVDGAPGSERRIVGQGRSPSWGGGTGRPFSRVAVKRRQRGTRVRGRLTVVRGATVGFKLVRKGRVIGRRSIAAADGGSIRFRVPLGTAGRRQLARGGRLRLSLRIAVTAPGGTPERARRSVTLRG